MKKTKKALLIESVFDSDIKSLLIYCYVEQRMSDCRIVDLFKRYDIVVNPSTIWCWRERLDIVSRPRSVRHKVEKTPKMVILETAMGGQECDKIIPWLWSMGKTSKEIVDFLNGFLYGVAIHQCALNKWLRTWGCCPDDHSKIRPRTSEALKGYFKEHPEVATKRSKNISGFFAEHPEIRSKTNIKISQALKKYYREHPDVRLKISQINSRVSRQRWARQEAARFCPLISENLTESLCKEIRGSDCKDCSFYSKEVRT